MIRINAVKAVLRFALDKLARDVKQRCERRLKKIFLSTSQKYQWLLIVR